MSATRLAVLLALAAHLSILPGIAFADSSPGCVSDAAPRFGRGFAELSALVGEPMGEPITCELPDPRGTGDVHQYTTRGLAYWRKGTNTPTFTNSSERWAITMAGFLYWQGQSIDPPWFVISGFSADPLDGYQSVVQYLAPDVVRGSLEGPREASSPQPLRTDAEDPHSNVPTPQMAEYVSDQMTGVLFMAGLAGLLLVLQRDLKARRECWLREGRWLASRGLALQAGRQLDLWYPAPPQSAGWFRPPGQRPRPGGSLAIRSRLAP